MNKLKIYPPSSLNSPDLMPPFSEFGYRFLAEGDSWFTVGALNPLKNSNLLFEMRFAQTGCVINCATPGDTLHVLGKTSGYGLVIERVMVMQPHGAAAPQP